MYFLSCLQLATIFYYFIIIIYCSCDWLLEQHPTDRYTPAVDDSQWSVVCKYESWFKMSEAKTRSGNIWSRGPVKNTPLNRVLLHDFALWW